MKVTRRFNSIIYGIDGYYEFTAYRIYYDYSSENIPHHFFIKSTDGGGTWRRILRNLGEFPIDVIALDSLELLTVTKNNVYYSNCAGENWINNLIRFFLISPRHLYFY